MSFVSDVWNSCIKPDQRASCNSHTSSLSLAALQDGKRKQSRRAHYGTTRIHCTGVVTVVGLHPHHMAVQADSTHVITCTNRNTIIQVRNTFSMN